MRLIDFNLSTADLEPRLPLYWEPQVNRLMPITAVELDHQRLLLIPKANGTPLTLDQLNARTRQLNGTVQLTIKDQGQAQLLFGYRLNQARLLFG